jgi:hemerythrin
MTAVHWSSSLEIGVPDIDHDHRHLIDLLNGLNAIDRADHDQEGVWDLLSELERYTYFHLVREEALMRVLGYEFLDTHRADHERLFLDVKNRIEDHPGGNGEVAQIMEFMQRWLLTHIAGSDNHLSTIVKRQRRLQAP